MEYSKGVMPISTLASEIKKERDIKGKKTKRERRGEREITNELEFGVLVTLVMWKSGTAVKSTTNSTLKI